MIMVLADLVSEDRPLPGSQMTDFALCPHMAEGPRDCSGVSSKGADHKGSLP